MFDRSNIILVRKYLLLTITVLTIRVYVENTLKVHSLLFKTQCPFLPLSSQERRRLSKHIARTSWSTLHRPQGFESGH